MGGELVSLPDIGYGGQLSRSSRLLIRRALRGATAVTAGSAYLRRMAEDRVAGASPRRLPLGVDTGLFQPRAGPAGPPPLRQGEVRLLHVASLVPVKDQHTLLSALALLAGRRPGVHLHVVGDGPMRASLRSAAAALGVAERVTFHGEVPHDRLPDYYRAADLCVLTSLHESQGMVALEAGACARATVGTGVGLLPELAPAACVVPVGDARALAGAVAALLRHPGAAAALGRATRRAVLDGFTLERAVGELCALYAHLSERRRGGGLAPAGPTSRITRR
jgi:glycosyltransferase involved in cell wall biosynthesis